MLVTFLLNALWHALTFIGFVYLAGFLIFYINTFFYKVTGYNKCAVYGTGIIGVPIHETSHLLMCLVFFHKVNEVKFFQINDEDGTLGYVNHSWNPKNIYQQIGNYFISVAPIIGGSLVIFFGMKVLLPTTYSTINEYFIAIQALGAKTTVFYYIFDMFSGMFTTMFSEISIGWQWWVFMVVSVCISLHMSLSKADLKNSLIAIPLLLVLIIAANLVIGFLFSGVYSNFLVLMNKAAGFLVCLLIFALVLSAICLTVAISIKGGVSGLKKIFKR